MAPTAYSKGFVNRTLKSPYIPKSMLQIFGFKWFLKVFVITFFSAICLSCSTNNINIANTPTTVSPSDAPEIARSITSYRSPTCGCCGEWVKHMEAKGFTVEDNITEDVESIKKKYGVPENLASCHTAIADRYVIEGHIPADDIQRLLQEAPKVIGIAVPGMPIGSPGMESGDIRQPYSVLSFTQDGKTQVFQDHPA